MPAQPFGASDGVAEGFPALLHGEGIGIHAPREPDAVALDADGIPAISPGARSEATKTPGNHARQEFHTLEGMRVKLRGKLEHSRLGCE